MIRGKVSESGEKKRPHADACGRFWFLPARGTCRLPAYAAPVLPTFVERREILRDAVVRWMTPAETALS